MDQRLLRTATAWLRGEVAWTRLMAVPRNLAFLEGRLRPARPRPPRATPQGGQWIEDNSKPAVRTTEDRIAANETPQRYFIDLEEEDRKGGHAYQDHVAKTRADLLKVMNDPRYYYRAPLGDGSVAYIYHPAEGTFHSAGEVSYWVERTLLAHPDLVEAAKHLPVGSRPVVIHHRFGQETGREAFRESYLRP